MTPCAGALSPTRNYGTVGHAAPGKALIESSAGADIGTRQAGSNLLRETSKGPEASGKVGRASA